MSLGPTLRRISRNRPWLNRFLNRLEIIKGRWHTRKRDRFSNILSVSPNQIIFKKKPYFHYIRDENQIQNGDWDQNLERFDSSITYRGLSDHFTNNTPWEQTVYFQYVLNQITSGNYLFECTDEKQLLERCHKIDDLYQSIKTHGITIPGPDSSLGVYDSITVNVGRDGSFIFNNGNHRLTIARILNIDNIPVRVLVRHQQWVDSWNSGNPPFEHADYQNNQS